jgi:hypothetical protein
MKNLLRTLRQSLRKSPRASLDRTRARALLGQLQLELLESRTLLTTLFVNTTATGGAFTTLQDAIAAAANGDTIQVAAGVYSQSAAITVNKQLTILGAQAGIDARPSASTTRVIGSTSESVIDVNGLSQGFVISADNVTIDGFDIRNATTALIDSSGSTTFTNAQIRNNIVHNASTAGGAKGIRLTAVTNSTVERNNIFTVADDGIEIGASAAGASTGAVVQFNEVHDLGSGGTTNSAIYAFAVGSTATALNVTIQGNLVYNHFGDDAIKVGATNGQDRLVSGGSVLDNIVHDTAQDGITIDASDTVVRRNEVYNSFSSNGAVHVEHGDNDVTVENNSIHDNSAGVAAVLVGFSGRPASPTGMVVRFNSIVNNTNNFLFFRDNTGGTATLDGSANWFGSASQPAVTASVKSTAGATATTNRVDFTPWLNNGTDADSGTPGFQPNFLSLTVAPSTVSLQTGGGGRIQEAIGLAAATATIDVLNGTYVENVSVNKDMTVNAAGTITGKVGSTPDGKIVATGTLSLGDGSGTGIILSGSLDVGAQTVTLLDSVSAVLDGATTLAGGTLTAANGISSGNASSLSGFGTVDATVDTAGTIAPGGASIGTLSIDAVTLVSLAKFAVDLDDDGNDQLLLDGGTLNLNGVVLTGTATANVHNGDSFTIIQAVNGGQISGFFDEPFGPNEVFISGQLFLVTYNRGPNGSVVLTRVRSTPSVTGATTNEDTQTTSGLVVSTPDGAEVTHFKITNIQNGTLFQSDGIAQIISGDFITVVQGNAGLKFIPSANFFGTGFFDVQTSLSGDNTGLGGGTATATITVTAVNDTPTSLALAGNTVAENKVAGTGVGTLSATDPDTADILTFSLVAGVGDTDNALFQVIGNELRTAAVLDFETKLSYSIRVRVTDAGGLTQEEVFTITVTDTADVLGFDVQKGAVQRSYIRYLTLTLSDRATAQALAASGRLKMMKADLNGLNAVEVALGNITVKGRTLTIDYAPRGFSRPGNPNVRDGYYTLLIDIDGDTTYETSQSFYRMLGDTNGDGRVSRKDLNAIRLALATGAYNANLDLDGNGFVDAGDLTLARNRLGRAIAPTLHLDD